MKPLRILLVEDDVALSTLVAELLVLMGHSVCDVVGTELDTVFAAAAHAPDLIMVDNDLRVGKGVAAMVTILKSSNVPHIYMTGGARSELPRGSTILHKPFGRERLAAALKAEISRQASHA